VSTESLRTKDGKQVCCCCMKALESLFLHIQQNNKWGAFLILAFFILVVIVSAMEVCRG